MHTSACYIPPAVLPFIPPGGCQPQTHAQKISQKIATGLAVFSSGCHLRSTARAIKFRNGGLPTCECSARPADGGHFSPQRATGCSLLDTEPRSASVSKLGTGEHGYSSRGSGPMESAFVDYIFLPVSRPASRLTRPVARPRDVIRGLRRCGPRPWNAPVPASALPA